MVNLDVIVPGKYFAHGTYGLSESGVPLPLVGEFNVEHLPNTLSIEGYVRREGTAHKHAIQCFFNRDAHSQSQADVSVTVDRTSNLNGRVSLLGPTVEVLAHDGGTTVLFGGRIVPLAKSREYEVSGLLSLQGWKWFAFHLHALPNEQRAAFENVVGITSKKSG